MKNIFTCACIVFWLLLNTQEVEKEGKTYEVKKEKIYLNGEEVTDSLNAKEKRQIISKRRGKMA